jgi:hypothetical protein
MDETPRRKKLPSLTGVPVVEIKWISAEANPNEDLSAEQWPVPQLKYSVGYLVGEDPEFLQVAAVINEHGTGDWLVAIPRVQILDERRRTR